MPLREQTDSNRIPHLRQCSPEKDKAICGSLKELASNHSCSLNHLCEIEKNTIIVKLKLPVSVFRRHSRRF